MDILSKPENPNQNRFEAKPNYKYLVESKNFYSKEPEAKTKNLNPKRTDSNRLAPTRTDSYPIKNEYPKL